MSFVKKTCDLISENSILNAAKCFFEEDVSQNSLIFQPVLKYFKPITDDMVMALKIKGLSDESIKPPTITANSLSPSLDYFNNTKFRVEFNESSLDPNRVTFAPNKII